MTSNDVRWRKSSYSGGQGGNCIEVGTHAPSGHVLVRDTKDRHGPMLRIESEAWREFTDRVKRSLGATGVHRASSARRAVGEASALLPAALRRAVMSRPPLGRHRVRRDAPTELPAAANRLT